MMAAYTKGKRGVEIQRHEIAADFFDRLLYKNRRNGSVYAILFFFLSF